MRKPRRKSNAVNGPYDWKEYGKDDLKNLNAAIERLEGGRVHPWKRGKKKKPTPVK